MAMGRPTKFKPEYCERLIDHMAMGKSFETFCACLFRESNGEIRVSRATLYNWCEQHPEFLDAKKLGIELSYEFWEELGITAVNTPPGQFNTGVWVFNMKNRFCWRDKVELSGDDEKPVALKADVNIKEMPTDELLQGIKGVTLGASE